MLTVGAIILLGCHVITYTAIAGLSVAGVRKILKK